MAITTEEFALTKDEYFVLLVKELFRWRWPLMIGLSSIAAYALLFTNHTVAGIGCAACAILYPLYILWHAWRFASCDDNRNVYTWRQYRFEDEFFHAEMEDGSDSRMRYEYVIRVGVTKQYYPLYLSKSQFICVPFRVFKSAEDHAAFETLLRNHNLM